MLVGVWIPLINSMGGIFVCQVEPVDLARLVLASLIAERWPVCASQSTGREAAIEVFVLRCVQALRQNVELALVVLILAGGMRASIGVEVVPGALILAHYGACR